MYDSSRNPVEKMTRYLHHGFEPHRGCLTSQRVLGRIHVPSVRNFIEIYVRGRHPREMALSPLFNLKPATCVAAHFPAPPTTFK